MSSKVQKQLAATKRYQANQAKKAPKVVSKPAQSYSSRISSVHQDVNVIKQQNIQEQQPLQPFGKPNAFQQIIKLQPKPVKTQNESMVDTVKNGVAKIQSFLGGLFIPKEQKRMVFGIGEGLKGTPYKEQPSVEKYTPQTPYKKLTSVITGETPESKAKSWEDSEKQKLLNKLATGKISQSEYDKTVAPIEQKRKKYLAETFGTTPEEVSKEETKRVGSTILGTMEGGSASLAKNIAKTSSKEAIQSMLKGYVKEESIPLVSNALKNVSKEKEVSNILKDYITKPLDEIKSAAIKVNGKVYEGVSHADAISKAPREIQDELMKNKETEGLFRTKDGKLITRQEAKSRYGITHSEELPHLKEAQKGKIIPRTPAAEFQHEIDISKAKEKTAMDKAAVVRKMEKEKQAYIQESKNIQQKRNVAEVKSYIQENPETIRTNEAFKKLEQAIEKGKKEGILTKAKEELEREKLTKVKYKQAIQESFEKGVESSKNENYAFEKRIKSGIKFEKEISKRNVKESLLEWKKNNIIAKEEANTQAKNFKIKNDDLTSITKHQSGESYEGKSIVENKFKELGDKAKKSGFEFDEKKNYIPQVYKEDAEQIKTAMAKYMKDQGVSDEVIDNYLKGIIELDAKKSGELGLSPFFSKSSAFPNYKTAMQYGLNPKYDKISSLVGHYTEKLGTAVANRKLVEDLARNGEISAIKGSGMQAVNIPGSEYGYFAKPETAKFINDLFRNEDALNGVERFFKYGSKASGELQNLVLAGGVPKSSLNFFTFGHVIKSITTGMGNLLMGDFRGLESNLKSVSNLIRSNFTKSSIKFFENKQPIINKMAQEGIDLTSRIGNYKELNRGFKEFFTKTEGKKMFGEGYSRLFDEKTFNSFLPMQQISIFEGAYKSGLAKKLSEEEASKLAGETVKKFSGISDTLRGKTSQEAINTVFFSPKFKESLINTYWNTIKSISPTTWKDSSYKQNRALLAGMGMSFLGYNLLNKKLTGHNMWENPAGHELELQIPREDGTILYTGFMPSQLSFFRNMFEGTAAFYKGETKTGIQKYGSNLSMGVQVITDITSNQDYFDNQIYDQASPGVEQLKSIGKYLGLGYNHPYVKGAYNIILNQQAENQPIWNKYKEITDLQQQGEIEKAKSIIDGLSGEDKDSYYAMKKEQLKPMNQVVSEMMELPIKFSTLGKIKSQQKYASMDEQERILKAIKDPEERKKALQDYLTSLPSSERKGAAYYLSQKDISTKGTTTSEAVLKGRPMLQKYNELIDSGKSSEANKYEGSLMDEEYKQYKAAEKSAKLQETNKFKAESGKRLEDLAKKVKELGNNRTEINKIENSLSDEEFNLYDKYLQKL